MSQSENPFRYFNSSPEVIRLVVMMYVRFPLSLRNVEDLLFERGIDICHETVGHWRNRFGPIFAADIRRQRVSRMQGSGTEDGISMRCAITGDCTKRAVDLSVQPDPIYHTQGTIRFQLLPTVGRASCYKFA